MKQISTRAREGAAVTRIFERRNDCKLQSVPEYDLRILIAVLEGESEEDEFERKEHK